MSGLLASLYALVAAAVPDVRDAVHTPELEVLWMALRTFDDSESASQQLQTSARDQPAHTTSHLTLPVQLPITSVNKVFGTNAFELNNRPDAVADIALLLKHALDHLQDNHPIAKVPTRLATLFDGSFVRYPLGGTQQQPPSDRSASPTSFICIPITMARSVHSALDDVTIDMQNRVVLGLEKLPQLLVMPILDQAAASQASKGGPGSAARMKVTPFITLSSHMAVNFPHALHAVRERFVSLRDKYDECLSAISPYLNYVDSGTSFSDVLDAAASQIAKDDHLSGGINEQAAVTVSYLRDRAIAARKRVEEAHATLADIERLMDERESAEYSASVPPIFQEADAGGALASHVARYMLVGVIMRFTDGASREKMYTSYSRFTSESGNLNGGSWVRFDGSASVLSAISEETVLDHAGLFEQNFRSCCLIYQRIMK